MFRFDFWASPFPLMLGLDVVGLVLWTPETMFAGPSYTGAFVMHAGAVYSVVWQMEEGYSYSWDKNPF